VSGPNTNDRRVFRVGYFFDGDVGFFNDRVLYLEGGRIRGIFGASDSSPQAEALRQEFLHSPVVDLPDAYLLPGLINAHQHFYSALALAVSYDERPPNFPELLRQRWWRLDRALNLESVALCAQVSALQGLRHGCTAVFDHHSSPSCIRGSLAAMAEALEPLQLTAVLCYETSDRNGSQAFADAVEENLCFMEACRSSENVRGMFGLHAGFTLGERSLKKVAELGNRAAPIHVHVAEDTCDVEHARSLGYKGPLDRLRAFGLLNEESLLVHGVHLSKYELQLAAELGCRVAICGESNFNNRVGTPKASGFRSDRILMGTDGMSCDMLATARATLLALSACDPAEPEPQVPVGKMLWDNAPQYLSVVLNRNFGRVRVGEFADFSIFPYVPVSPVTSETAYSHIMSGVSMDARASWVYANGVPVLENGEFTMVDEAAIQAEARRVSVNLAQRFESLTPFP
jgi:cytosine/adenosine deaminase-related metal-dependent hydrolase